LALALIERADRRNRRPEADCASEINAGQGLERGATPRSALTATSAIMAGW
jgi:hypothetical protein